jgi:hypothetical protein
MAFLKHLSVWVELGSVRRPNPYSTWACIDEDLTLIYNKNLTETNMQLCLQDFENGFCTVDLFPPNILREDIWDPFEMMTLKAKGLSHVFPDRNSWNVQIFAQRS